MPRFQKVAIRYSPGVITIYEISTGQDGDLKTPVIIVKNHDEFKPWLVPAP
jgi:hypothetical protein